ncbi:hypothetical protein V8C86DRAFT_237140 [Haematococcus lacustris]
MTALRRRCCRCWTVALAELLILLSLDAVQAGPPIRALRQVVLGAAPSDQSMRKLLQPGAHAPVATNGEREQQLMAALLLAQQEHPLPPSPVAATSAQPRQPRVIVAVGIIVAIVAATAIVASVRLRWLCRCGKTSAGADESVKPRARAPEPPVAGAPSSRAMIRTS